MNGVRADQSKYRQNDRRAQCSALCLCTLVIDDEIWIER